MQSPFITPDLPFDYQLIRSRRRTLGISVANAEVCVRAPLKAPKYWINEFLLEKSDWIQRKLEEQQQQLKEIYLIAHGATIPFLDEQLTIDFVRGSKYQAFRRAQSLVISSPDSDPAETGNALEHCQSFYGSVANEKQLKAFFRWLARQAKLYMTERTSMLAQTLELTDKLTDVRFRRTSSKWGHCTSEGVIQYNPQIMMAPAFVVDYIVAHEVCHLKHRNHSKTYWRFVDRACNDRHRAERWLKENGHRLAVGQH